MNAGLAVFIGVLVLDLAGLAADGVLYAMGLPTVTAYARLHPLLAAVIVGLQVAGAIGLACHFDVGSGKA